MTICRSVPQVTGRVWRGSAFGGVKGRTELPGIVGGKYSLHRSTPIVSKPIAPGLRFNITISLRGRLHERQALGRRVCHPPP